MENPFDQKFVELYKDSESIIDKINKLLLEYKEIDDILKLGFVHGEFQEFLKSNKNICKDLGDKINKSSQKFVIFGETNAGKSSFINALIFQSNILPTGSASTTKCFVEIKQSSNKTNYLVVDDKTEDFEKRNEVIKLKITKTKENNRKRHVKLFYNFNESDYFANNVIIDTPGTNFDEDYDENILQHCNEADIVILVVNASTQIGLSMKQFCEKFKNKLSKLNLYVVFSHYDFLQLKDDWEEGINENIATLTGLFPTADLDKMAFISSSERMEVIKSNEFVFKDEKSRERNNSFLHLSEQIKNERDQISMSIRYGCLRKILEIMNKYKQIMTKRSPFFEVNLAVLCCLTSSKDKIQKLVLSYCETLRNEACEMKSNENDSENTPLINNENLANNDDENLLESEAQKNEKILQTIGNEIKQKLREEIINYIEKNNINDKDKLILSMENIYFPRIMDKIHLKDPKNVLVFIKENKGNIEIAIGAATGAVGLGVTLATIPAWPVLLPLELTAGALAGIGIGGAVGGATIGGGLGAAFGKIVNLIIEEIPLKNLMTKFGDELFQSFSKFQQQSRKISDLSKRRQKINGKIEDFEMKMDSFQHEYSIETSDAKTNANYSV